MSIVKMHEEATVGKKMSVMPKEEGGLRMLTNAVVERKSAVTQSKDLVTYWETAEGVCQQRQSMVDMGEQAMHEAKVVENTQ